MSDETDKVPVEKLVRVYLKMNATLTEMRHAYEAPEKALKEKMATVKRDYWTSDWDSMRKFIVEHKVPELLHERIHQTNMKQFLEEHPDLLPPGLNVDSEYTITVRRK